MALSNAFLSRLRELSDEAQPQRQVPSPTSSVSKSGQRQAETPTVQNPSMNVQPAGWAGMAAARGTVMGEAPAATASAAAGGPDSEPPVIEYGENPATDRYSLPLGNIGRATGFGWTPWGAAGQFSRAGSMYPTFWSYQPGLGGGSWVPAAQAAHGGGYGGYGGMYAGGSTGPGSSAWGSGYSSSYTGAQNTGGNLYPRLQT